MLCWKEQFCPNLQLPVVVKFQHGFVWYFSGLTCKKCARNMQEICQITFRKRKENRKQKVEREKVHACRSRRNQSGSTMVCRQTAKLDVCMNARLRAGCDVYLHTTEILKKICIYCFLMLFFLLLPLTHLSLLRSSSAPCANWHLSPYWQKPLIVVRNSFVKQANGDV